MIPNKNLFSFWVWEICEKSTQIIKSKLIIFEDDFVSYDIYILFIYTKISKIKYISHVLYKDLGLIFNFKISNIFACWIENCQNFILFQKLRIYKKKSRF